MPNASLLRSLLAASALLVLTAVPTAQAAITVDPLSRTVETPHFIVRFDNGYGDRLWDLAYKDFDPALNLSTFEANASEFWGQSLRGVDSTGFIQPLTQEASDWAVTFQSANQVAITITALSSFEPLTVTTYHFYADAPYMVIERTVHFSAAPETSAYQAYLPRMSFTMTYHAVRYRDSQAHLQQRIHAYGGLLQGGWDGRWLQQVGMTGTRGFTMSALYDSSLGLEHEFVRGYGPSSYSGWAAPYTPRAYHSHDETSRFMLAFSTAVHDTAAVDSLYAFFNAGGWLLAAPLPAGSARLALAAAPNPARGAVRLAWALPSAGDAELAIFDIAGRRVATLTRGPAAAGEHASAWDGRGPDGAAVAPGVYVARLVTPAGSHSVLLARSR